MSPTERNDLIAHGNAWRANVWMGANYVYRDNLLTQLNGWLGPSGFNFRHGWQHYDPVVRYNNTAHTYATLSAAAAASPNGGRDWARQFLDWCNLNNVLLAHLPAHMRCLAVITHFAEVGRNYTFAVNHLLPAWMTAIRDSGSNAAAAALWLDYGNQFPPSLTYAVDAAQNAPVNNDDDDDDEIMSENDNDNDDDDDDDDSNMH